MRVYSKCIAVVLSLALVMSLTPAAAFAQEEEVATDPGVVSVAASEEAAETEAESNDAAEPEATEPPETTDEPIQKEVSETDDPIVEPVQEESPETAIEYAQAGPIRWDKADCYEDAEGGFAPRAAFGPMYLSDEMKYFAREESACNYDQGFSYGDGYHALGYYQFDHRYVLQDFLIACYNYNKTRYSMFKQFTTISSSTFRKEGFIGKHVNGRFVFTTNGKNLEAAWHAAYAKAPKEFAGLQDAWAYNNYYLQAHNYLLSKGIDISNRADCVKGLCWGLCNLFGPGGWRWFVTGSGVNNSMSDVKFVKTLCNFVINNVSFYQYGASYKARYQRELQTCLKYLEESKGGLVKSNDGRLRFLKSNGAYAKNEWVTVSGKTYRFNANGYALKGKWWVSGRLYYFKSDYSMHTGWLTWSADGSKSYFSSKHGGAAAKGWWTLGGKRYYFDPSSRKAALSSFVTIGGKTYYFGASCNALRYSLRIDGKLYYFKSDYSMHTGWLTWSADGSKSYFSSKHGGAAAKGWWTLGGKRYYFDPSTCKTLRYKQWIGGELYYFLADSSMHTGWVTWNSDKRKSFFSPNSKGKAARGWWTISGKKYYFDNDRKMLSNGWLTISGKKCYFDSKGVYQPNATA